MNRFTLLLRRTRSPWRPLLALLFGTSTLLTLGCADDAFLPPPGNPPYGTTNPSDVPDQPPPAPPEF